jgi:hypothetical protein
MYLMSLVYFKLIPLNLLVAGASKGPDEPESPPVTTSRSGRVIKQKPKFSTEVGGAGDALPSPSTPQRSNVDSQIEDPRKIWVKMKGSGDLIEINLDKDKPER